MLRKPLATLLMIIPGLSVTLVAMAGAGSYFAAEPPTIPGAPYSAVATTQSTTVFSDGTHIVRGNTVRFFRDAQGRTRTERGVDAEGHVLPGETNPTITINDPVSGTLYRLYPQKRIVQALKLSHGAPLPPPSPTSDAEAPFALLGFGMAIGAGPATETSTAESSLGQKVIGGLTASGTRLVRTIPSGVLGNDKPITSTRDEWVSPDLGVVVQITEKSTIGGEVTLNLSNVVRGEPDASLFVPPANFTMLQFPSAGVASAAPSGTVSR